MCVSCHFCEFLLFYKYYIKAKLLVKSNNKWKFPTIIFNKCIFLNQKAYYYTSLLTTGMPVVIECINKIKKRFFCFYEENRRIRSFTSVFSNIKSKDVKKLLFSTWSIFYSYEIYRVGSIVKWEKNVTTAIFIDQKYIYVKIIFQNWLICWIKSGKFIIA